MKLVIEQDQYTLPDKLTLKIWRELMSWGFVEENYDIIISIAFDIPLTKTMIIPDETKYLAIVIIQSFMSPIIVEDRKIKINLNKITFGDFVDMEVYIGNGIHKNLEKAIPLLFDLEYSEDLFINDIWDGLMVYFNFRNSIFNRYRKLFNADDEPEDDEEKNKKPIEYIWWEILMILSDEKFLNIDEAVKKPLIQALNYISWNKDKNTREINRIKKARNEL